MLYLDWHEKILEQGAVRNSIPYEETVRQYGFVCALLLNSIYVNI